MFVVQMRYETLLSPCKYLSIKSAFREFCLAKASFYDTVLSMGCRSSAYIAQRFPNAITFMFIKLGIYILNYTDDLARVEVAENAQFAFLTLQKVLRQCGTKVAVKSHVHGYKM